MIGSGFCRTLNNSQRNFFTDLKQTTMKTITSIIFAAFAAFYSFGQTQDQVFDEIVANGIKSPEIVLCQSILETGHFNCDNCSLDKNNLFGFFWRGEYLSFDTWKDSVKYYANWQKRHLKPGEDYFDFLVRIHYASDPLYIDKLKDIQSGLN